MKSDINNNLPPTPNGTGRVNTFKQDTITSDDHSVNTSSTVSNDSHNDNSIDNSTHTHNVVNQNIIYQGAAAAEKLQADARDEYRRFCLATIRTQTINLATRRVLDIEARRLGINDKERKEIERETASSFDSGELSSADRMAIDVAAEAIRTNAVSSHIVERLCAMAESREHDEVQFYANLLLAAYSPQECITRYESRSFDSYWQTFWVYIAYKKKMRLSQAEKELAKLSAWSTSYPVGNISLLSASGALYEYFAVRSNAGEEQARSAAKYLSYAPKISSYLLHFSRAVRYMLNNASRPLYRSGNPELDFYLNIFGAQEKPARIGWEEMSSTGTVSIPGPISVQRQAPVRAAVSYPSGSYKRRNYKRIISLAAGAILLSGSLLWIWHTKWRGANDVSDCEVVVVDKPLFYDTQKDRITTIYEYLSKRGYTGSMSSLKKELNNTAKRREVYSILLNDDYTDIGASFEDFEQMVFGSPAKPSAAIRQKNAARQTAATPKKANSSQPTSEKTQTVNQTSAVSAPEPVSAANPSSSQAETLDGNTACRIGLKYLYGEGVAPDNATALTYFRYAAEAGNVKGMYWTGWCYRTGRGTTKNLSMAKSWWQKAAARGNPEAARGLEELESLM